MADWERDVTARGLLASARSCPEVKALVKAAQRWAKLSGTLTVAFAQLERLFPEWFRDGHWLKVTSAILETNKALAPFEDAPDAT